MDCVHPRFPFLDHSRSAYLLCFIFSERGRVSLLFIFGLILRFRCISSIVQRVLSAVVGVIDTSGDKVGKIYHQFCSHADISSDKMGNSIHNSHRDGARQIRLRIIEMGRENRSLYFKCILEANKMDVDLYVEFIAGFCYEKRREVL